MVSGWSAARWYCTALALVLGVRATSTLLMGADFEVPGTGWRSVWQLIMVALLVFGVACSDWTDRVALTVAAIYLLATVSEAFDGNTLVAAIPVDMRDRYLHPLFAIVAVVCVLLGRRRARVAV